ncbi:MAG: Uma2 family endonuclease [Janthinobacterium lividum]
MKEKDAMGQAELQPRRYTPQEYFALEAQSQEKHEYFDGEIFAMAGSSKAHNLLARRLAQSIETGLGGRNCKVYTSDIKLAITENFHYTYSDVVVSCDPADQRDAYLVRHPLLVAEVLSPSTADYDRSTKMAAYQKLPSLRHYLLIWQAGWTVDWYRRTPANEWVHTLLDGPEAILEIPDLDLRLPLAELHCNTGVAPLRVEPSRVT